MERKVTELDFDLGQLLQAASIAGINSADIPSNANPWTWEDDRARSWQTAFRSLNPVGAQDAEIAFGKPLSLALQAALEGLEPMNPDLERELAIKRPHRLDEMREAAIQDALAGMEEALAAEKARMAASTLTQEQHLQQVAASNRVAYAHGSSTPPLQS